MCTFLYSFFSCFKRLVLGGVALVLVITSSSRAEVIAFWRFESATTFLDDSSGHGHTLLNGGGSLDATFSTDVGTGGGSGSASFDGGDVLRTAATLDLTPYRHLRISWLQKQTASSGVKVVFEDTTNFNSTDGAFLSAVNSDLSGTDASTTAYVNLNGLSANNSDIYPQSPGSWIALVAEINLDATPSGKIVQVFDGSGSPIGTDRDLGSAPSAFLNDTLYIGARGSGAAIGFLGNIDELKIEAVPEPSTWMLLALGSAALLGAGRRLRSPIGR